MTFKKNYSMALAGLLTFVLIGLVEKNHGDKAILHVAINIEQQYDNFFVDRGDIHRLISKDNSFNVIGLSMSKIELKKIEERIRSNKFVKEAEVYKDLEGSLIVNVKQRRPIARFIRDSGPDAYVSETGVILPVSERFTARVVLINGQGVNALVKGGVVGEDNHELLELLRFIDRDLFWKAQISQIVMGKNKELLMYPQVGKQVIDFGSAADYEVKLRKLKIFFTKILPLKGWNHYTRVNIKYKNQIVCE